MTSTTLISLEDPSNQVAPRCVHAGICGGCASQGVSYEAQLLFKQQQIEQLFAADIEKGAVLRKIIPCDDPWHYRNKMEFSFSQDKAGNHYLGLMMRRGRVLNLQECHITSSWMIEALKITHSWWDGTELNAYHPYRNTGTFRTLTLREGKRTQDKMAILTVSGHPDYAISKKDLDAWVKILTEQFPHISCFLRIHQTCKGVPTQFYELHLAGPDHIEEIMEIDLGEQKITLRLNISPQSFFQPNTFQAERLYSEALQLLNLSNAEHVIDLYAGTATIGMALSQKAGKVTSIELNPYAMMDAQANLEANEISNLELIKGDAAEVLAQLEKTPTALVVDPPRSGLGPKAIQPILKLMPPKILYISCNPRTQATDIELLTKNGYHLKVLQPVDQFPHTPHIENIALLTLGE